MGYELEIAKEIDINSVVQEKIDDKVKDLLGGI